MSKQIEAVYENGVLRPVEPIELLEGEHIHLILIIPDAENIDPNGVAEVPTENAPLSLEDERLTAMQEAANDRLFLADLHEVSADFVYADAEDSAASI